MGAVMLEITKDMLDEAIKDEKKSTKVSNISAQLAVCFLLAVAAVEALCAFSIMNRDIIGALIFLLISAAADIVLLFIIIFLMSLKSIKRIPFELLVYSFKLHKFNKTVQAADDDNKILLYESKLAKNKGRDRLLYINGLIPLYVRKNRFDKAEELLRQAESIVPKNFMQRCAKATSYFIFYASANDGESYTKAYLENESIIDEMWNDPLSFKISALTYTKIFIACSGDYNKAIEYYLNVAYFQEKAGEINVIYEKSEDEKNAANIDLAELYCKSGDREKSAEYFKKAKEALADTDVPFYRSELERVGKILDEAGIDHSCSDNAEE